MSPSKQALKDQKRKQKKDVRQARKDLRQVHKNQKKNQKDIDKARNKKQKADTENEKEAAADRLDELIHRKEQLKKNEANAAEKVGEERQEFKKADKKLEKKRREQDSKGQPSPNFSYSEFNCNNGTPVPESCEPAVKDLCVNRLEKMRDKFGPAHVNSGYRTAAYNASIGGATGSYHIYPEHPGDAAADCTFAQGSPSDWASYARGLGIGGVGQYSSFVHIDNRNYVSHWYG